MDADAVSDDVHNEGSEEGDPQLEPPSEGNELVASENATGTDTVPHEENEASENLSDASDAGWDTDLEIEEEKDEYDPTGCKDYFKTCNVLGIIPVSSFVKTLREGKAEVLLRHHGLGPKGAKAIAIALMTNTIVSHLDISDNGLEVAGGIAIATMLKDNNYIVHLDLSDNFLGSPAAFAVASMAKVNSTITHCYLSGNCFDDKAAEPIGEMIRGSYRITHLNLSRNELGEEGGVILGSALAESEVLQFLDLSWNHIRGKGATAIAEGLKASAIALANALKINTTLEELDISNNRIGENGATAISKILSTNDGLKLGKNTLRSEHIEPILNSVKGNLNSPLQCLSFERNTLSLVGEKLVKELKETHPNLEIMYAATEGHQIEKPIPPPLEKLKKYAVDNKLELKDLFQSFDKEYCGLLSEEDFRNALTHISAPLIEIEKQRLIKQFQKEKVQDEGQEKEKQEKEKDETEAQPVVFVDYNALLSNQ
ncbi:hypothetical protein EMCRGX_G024490 [Ephydatia muelleri]